MGRNVIGKYQGREVYKVTLPEYVNGRYYRDTDYIFLINGELIYNNEVFASYDGNFVSLYDPHKKRTFYTVPTFTVNNKSLSKEGYDTADGNFDSKDSKETSSTFGNETKTKSVEETLAGVFDSSAIEGVYETDYFSGMTDVDAFLKTNLEF